MLPEYNTLMSQFGNQKHRCVHMCACVCVWEGGGGLWPNGEDTGWKI